MEKPMLYVCLLSEHNVAEFQAVKTLRPGTVLAIASRFIQKKASHERFRHVAGQIVSDLRILGEELEGDHYGETCAWAREKLLPLLKGKKADRKIIFNFTGGTKAMSMAIRDTGADLFDELHYSSLDRTELQVIRGSQAWESIPLAGITPMEQARLYSEHVSERSAVTPPCPPELLQRLWRDYSETEPVSRYKTWKKRLKDIWEGKKEALEKALEAFRATMNGEVVKKKYVVVPLDTCRREGLDPEWFAAFAVMDTNQCTGIHDGMLRIPIDKEDGKAKHFIKWFMGTWFEELVAGWLIEDGVRPEHLVTNVIIKAAKIDSGNEGDILLQQRGRLYLLEAKAGDQDEYLKPGSVDKLHSAAGVLGKVVSAFILATPLSGSQRTIQFLSHAAAKEIRVLASRNELRGWLGIVEEDSLL